MADPASTAVDQHALPGRKATMIEQALPCGHHRERRSGGGVEVDPTFDISEMPGFAALRLPCAAQGTLFVAELSLRTDAKPRPRPMA